MIHCFDVSPFFLIIAICNFKKLISHIHGAMLLPRAGLFNLNSIEILCCIIICWSKAQGGSSVHCRMFSIIPDLCPLDANSIPKLGQSKISSDIGKCHIGVELPLDQNYCFTKFRSQDHTFFPFPKAVSYLPKSLMIVSTTFYSLAKVLIDFQKV